MVIAIQPLSAFDYMRHEREIQQRLSTLELDLDRWRRRSKDHLQRSVRRFDRHIESETVVALTRDLTIRTRVLAAERNYEQVETREIGQAAQLRSRLQRQQVKCDFRIGIEQEVL